MSDIVDLAQKAESLHLQRSLSACRVQHQPLIPCHRCHNCDDYQRRTKPRP